MGVWGRAPSSGPGVRAPDGGLGGAKAAEADEVLCLKQ